MPKAKYEALSDFQRDDLVEPVVKLLPVAWMAKRENKD